MHPKLLLGLMGVLALAGIPVQADNGFGPSPGATTIKDDALGPYKEYTHRIIGSYWYPAIDQAAGIFPAGKVRLRFTVHSDGHLSDLVVVEGKGLKSLAALGQNSVQAPAPYRPFDQALIKQVGEKYTDELTFTVGARK